MENFVLTLVGIIAFFVFITFIALVASMAQIDFLKKNQRTKK